MSKKSIISITLSAAILLIPLGMTAQGLIEEWVPFVPGISQLKFLMENQISYVRVAITFNTGGYNISTWGTVTRNGNSFSVNSEIWRWTGVVTQVIWTATYTYELGQLDEGSYTFTFSTWSIPVKTISFTIGMTGDLNYDGKIDIKDIAEVASAFGSYPTHPRWNPLADITGPVYLMPDEKVDIRDLALIASDFGKTYTQ